MHVEIHIPAEVPVMTLPGAVLFPQAIMPLYIFEPRYQAMLQDVLASSRLFAVGGLDEERAQSASQFEPLFPTATLGLVRICRSHEDGTANLAIQGLARVRVNRIVSEEPYRVISVTPLLSHPGGKPKELDTLRAHLSDLIDDRLRCNPEIPEDFLDFLHGIDDPDIFIDLTAHSLCGDLPVKQRLLETLDTATRLRVFTSWLAQRNREDLLLDELGAHLDEDDVYLN